MLSSPEEVILWQPDPSRAWQGPKLGDLVLFRVGQSGRKIVGHGRYVETTRHTVEDAWSLFGPELGVWTKDKWFGQIRSQLAGGVENDPEIALAIVAWPVFFPPLNPFTLPAAFAADKLSVPLCSARGPNGCILLESLRYHARRTLGVSEAAQERLLGLETYRVPGTPLRVGRRAGRSLITKLYGHRCAISAERVSVTQDVVHVRRESTAAPICSATSCR